MTKMAEDMEHRDFRERARDDYNNRRAEGRLGVLSKTFSSPYYTMVTLHYYSNPLAPAQLTCATLDEQMGKSVSFFRIRFDTFFPKVLQ
jgi:hypothetical protein